MRFLAALGALLFLYLAIIPAGLIYSTLDSACAGGACETSVLSRVLFTALYGACLLAIVGTAGLFAAYAVRGTLETQQRLPRAMALTGSVVGIALFVLFAVAFPLGGAVALALAAGGYLGVRVHARRGQEAEPGSDPSGNGHPRLNGHSENGHRTIRGRP